MQRGGNLCRAGTVVEGGRVSRGEDPAGQHPHESGVGKATKRSRCRVHRGKCGQLMRVQQGGAGGGFNRSWGVVELALGAKTLPWKTKRCSVKHTHRQKIHSVTR